MSFQIDTPFAGFLRTTAKSAVIPVSAPAANFLLEERLPVPREQTFLSETPGPAPGGWNVPAWLQTYANHYYNRIARPNRRPAEVATFAAENQDNHLAGIESNQDVVRLMSVKALHERYGTEAGFDTPKDLANALTLLVRSREPGQGGLLNTDQRAQLADWLDGLNPKMDARPAFAAPFDEVESLLAAPDWATQLRNKLGLSHFAASSAKPLPVVLCRYNLSRVEGAARKARVAAWAAIPTVLEAGGNNGPGAAFFPFPKAVANSSFGFGVTVDLSPNGGLDFKSELLHFRIDYTLDDFVAVGEITDEVLDAQLAVYRQRHFSLLEQDLKYRSDVP